MHLKADEGVVLSLAINLCGIQLPEFIGGKISCDSRTTVGCFQPDEIEIILVLNICWRRLGLQPNTSRLPQGIVPNRRIFCQKHYHHMQFSNQ